MRLIRLDRGHGVLGNLLRVAREKPEIVVAPLEDGSAPLPLRHGVMVSTLSAAPVAVSPLKRLLIRWQAARTHLFLARERSVGVAAAMRWGLPLERIRLGDDRDEAIVETVVRELRAGRGGTAWHRR